MDVRRQVWVPDPNEGYRVGIIKDISSDLVTVAIKESHHIKEVVAPYAQTFPCEEYDKDVDDNCSLMYLNEATLLSNLRIRYAKDSIYTYVANILIAVNPYKKLEHLYDNCSIESYQGRSLGTRPPHIFAIADKAHRDMKHLKENQSIIVSGESGAGKTESTKYILKYLTESWGSRAGPIEQRIVESNPLLEAFGNAKTMRNNNSSRFGKFVEIHFDVKHQVCGSFISHYLLEKSRICLQSPEERNYHIFYRMCAGAPHKLRSTLKLGSPDQFHYLRGGCTQYFCNKENETRIGTDQRSAATEKCGLLRDITLDDVSDFNLTDSAMTHMGLSEKIKIEIYRVISGVLHLGNISFEDPPPNDTSGGCNITDQSQTSLEVTAILLGCDKEQLSNSLVTRTMRMSSQSGRKNSDILVPLKTNEAQNARDALAKAVYSKLFDFIVSSVNKSLPFSESNNYIGLLDIAGFEYFQTNSFEQFCINYCNEKLQQFFNERILKEEQALYEKEELKVKKIHYVDNQDCIDLIESKPIGIFYILDEESKLPKPSSEHFTMEVHKLNRDHARLNIPRKSKLKAHREIRDGEGFLLRHFAGAVCYESAQFIEKNNDALHHSLESIVLFSKSAFLKSIFDSPSDNLQPVMTSSVMTSSSSTSGKLGFVSVGSKFQSQLTLLMEKLRSTGTNFIRCIKPNSKMVPRCFEGTQILTQLQCSGMPSVLDLMHQGFPSRTPFAELYEMYKRFMPPNIARLDPRMFCRALFKALGLNEFDFKFGMTKVFFRPGKFAEFDELIKSDPDHLAELIKKVQRWLLRMRWKKAQWSVFCIIRVKNIMEMRKNLFIMIQSYLRSWKVRKEYLPRLKCLTKIRLLYIQLEPMKKMVLHLKEGQVAAMDKVDSLVRQVEGVIKMLQTSDSLSPTEVDDIHSRLMSCMDGTLMQLKIMVEEEREAEERERMRMIQEKLDLEKHLREEEEVKKREAEKIREEKEREKQRRKDEENRARAEIEARRLAEENAERIKKDGETIKLDEARIIREQEAIERAIKERQLDQDRMDRELALRLAAEDESLVEDPYRYDYSLPKKQNILQRTPGQRILPLPTPSFNLFGSSQIKATPQALTSGASTNQRRSEPSPNPLYNPDVLSSFDPLVGGADVLRSAATSMPSKVDLTTWKYADLRDIINTCCDVDMLERCREEVHRRLMVYHDWRLKNQVTKEEERAPQSIMDIVQNPYVLEQFSTPSPTREQRFFRIPFKRIFDSTRPDLVSSGWWLAHFDGNWVARQMELHPGKAPVLLVAGADDMKLCELSLPQTGLTKKEGAEILEREFEEVWVKNGGNEYLIMVAGKVTSRYLRFKMGLSHK